MRTVNILDRHTGAIRKPAKFLAFTRDNYGHPCAIVEIENGRIEVVDICTIQFTDAEEDKS